MYGKPTLQFIILAPVLFLINACGGGDGGGGLINTSASGDTIQSNDPVPTGFTNTIPTCPEARERILTNVELEMTLAQVRSIVGKPRTILRGNSEFEVVYDWLYSDYRIN